MLFTGLSRSDLGRTRSAAETSDGRFKRGLWLLTTSGHESWIYL